MPNPFPSPGSVSVSSSNWQGDMTVSQDLKTVEGEVWTDPPEGMRGVELHWDDDGTFGPGYYGPEGDVLWPVGSGTSGDVATRPKDGDVDPNGTWSQGP